MLVCMELKRKLPDIWEDLGMRSASTNSRKHAQLKAVLVKVLSIWYAIHDTTWHSFRKTFEYIDTPHKFKMGVSGCQSCVESGNC